MDKDDEIIYGLSDELVMLIFWCVKEISEAEGNHTYKCNLANNAYTKIQREYPNQLNPEQLNCIKRVLYSATTRAEEGETDGS